MKNLCKIIFLCLILSINAEAQTVTWQKWYDYDNLEDNGQDVIQTFDGGYAILSNSYTNPNPKTEVFKTDQFGNVEWRKLYDVNNVGGNSLNCRSIAQTKDSSFIISGRNKDSAIIFKINQIGNIIWIKRYSKLGRFAGFWDHNLTFNNGIIGCGYLYDPSIGYVVKTDSIGNIEWDSVYNYTTTVIRIIESSDGSFYMLGINTSEKISDWNKMYYPTSNIIQKNHSKNFPFYSNGIETATLIKINNIGKIIWKLNMFLPNATDLINHPSGNIFVSGGHDSLILYKIDTTGAVLFQKSYYRGVVGCFSMCLSQDGNILLGSVLEAHMAASKIEPNGKLIFNKQISSINNTEFAFLPYAVNPTNDSGFIFTGFTNYPPNLLESNTYASKTDSLCSAPLIVSISKNDVLLPVDFILYQNYPNPFNPNTRIKYNIYKAGFVNLKVFDLKGIEICSLINKVQQPGNYDVQFNSIKYYLSSGLFYCKLSVQNKSSIIKLILLK